MKGILKIFDCYYFEIISKALMILLLSIAGFLAFILLSDNTDLLFTTLTNILN